MLHGTRKAVSNSDHGSISSESSEQVLMEGKLPVRYAIVPHSTASTRRYNATAPHAWPGPDKEWLWASAKAQKAKEKSG